MTDRYNLDPYYLLMGEYRMKARAPIRLNTRAVDTTRLLDLADKIAHFDHNTLKLAYNLRAGTSAFADDYQIVDHDADGDVYDLYNLWTTRRDVSELLLHLDNNEPDVLDTDMGEMILGSDVAKSATIRGLRIYNTTGYNDDPRSHRGDCVDYTSGSPTFLENGTILATPIRPVLPGEDISVTRTITASCIGFPIRIPEDLPSDESRRIFECIDEKLWHAFEGRVQLVTEIVTLRHLCAGIMFARGSKFDKNYEMLMHASVRIDPDNMIEIKLEFDHGS